MFCKFSTEENNMKKNTTAYAAANRAKAENVVLGLAIYGEKLLGDRQFLRHAMLGAGFKGQDVAKMANHAKRFADDIIGPRND